MANKTIDQLQRFPSSYELEDEDLLIMYDKNKPAQDLNNTKSITIGDFKSKLNISGHDSRIQDGDIENWNNKVDSLAFDEDTGESSNLNLNTFNIFGGSHNTNSGKSSNFSLRSNKFQISLDDDGTELNKFVLDSNETRFLQPIYMNTTSSSSDALVTKQYVDDSIAGAQRVRFESVGILPQVGQSNIIYLVPAANSATSNTKDEYIWLSNINPPTWEKIGSTNNVDLSNYVTTSAISGNSTGMIFYATSGTSTFPYFGSNAINGSTTSIGAGTYAPGYVLIQAAETTAQGQNESSIIGLTPSSISVATKEFIFSDVDDQTEINAKNVDYFTAPNAQFNTNKADAGYQVVNLNTLSYLIPLGGNIVHADNSTIYLPTLSWASTTINGQSCYTQTVSNLKNLANYYDVIVSPSPYYIKEYAENGVYCAFQATSALTFVANSTATLNQNGVYVNYITIQKQAPDQLN